MHLRIYCFIALVAVGVADSKPIPALSSSLAPVQKFGKRFATPELTLYLTRDIIKALQADELSKISGSQRSDADISQKKNRGFVSRFFLPKDKEVIENQEKRLLTNFYSKSFKDNNIFKQLQNSQQNHFNKEKSLAQTNANLVPYIPVSQKNQEEILRHEQLKQQWKGISERNPAQLQGLSTSKQQHGSIQIDENKIQQQVLRIEDQKLGVEKEIENIVKNDPAFSFTPSNSPNHSPPVLIHKEVTITKHLPVPIYNGPKVPVPRPVWVPIPEPYVVIVPQRHPYPSHIF